MSNERLAELAVEALAATLETYIAAQLDAIETEQSLAAGTLPDFAAVERSNVPGDPRTPLLEVYDTDSAWVDFYGRIFDVTCKVAFSVVHADADPVPTDRLMRRYYTAVIKTLRAHETLGDLVLSATPGACTSGLAIGEAEVRAVSELTVVVRVQDA